MMIHTAPAGTGTSYRGMTLTKILYDAAARSNNPRLLNQPQADEWRPFSLDNFRRHSEETAVGLLDLGLQRGDRVALYMESDAYFCIVDMACLIAGLVDVPIYLTHASEQVKFVIDHSEATTVVVSTLKHLDDIRDVLADCPTVKYVVVAEMSYDDEVEPLPGDAAVTNIADVREQGRGRIHDNVDGVQDLLQQIQPDDLATIIYTSGTTGRPKGVMLTHENISHNALTAFSGLPDYQSGPDGEIAISFLPLTHIFARALYYGYIYHASTLYFSTPERLAESIKRVHPTIFATVPRVLEKVYGSILDRISEMSPLKQRIAHWALSVGERYEIGREPSLFLKLQLQLADRLMFRQWREALGGSVKYIISGGAALSPRLANLFAAAGVTVLQGYGLTETSPVIAFNRPARNRAGTVGEPIPDVEVKIAEDGEILTRGPHIMKGYFRDEERTKKVIDKDGWFHTGDIGEFTEAGHLRITDRKKDLFKLSTGKYVMPQPIENRLTTNPLIEQAVVVGSDFKYCTALLFPDQDKLRTFAKSRGVNGKSDVEDLLRHDVVRDRFRALVEEANKGMDPWSRVKRCKLVAAHLTPENGLLTPTMKVRRARVQEEFAEEIESMYEDADEGSYIVVESHDAGEKRAAHAAA